MREASRTTRERIADALREEPLTASALAREFEIQTSEAIRHLEHIAKSIDAQDEEFLVAPPTCQDCGFDRFDDLINRPSRCPECKSEAIEDPAFRVS
jgi:predicted Zn-ribbon and HTH transcriptional regulator